jgi:hypothetical protein
MVVKVLRKLNGILLSISFCFRVKTGLPVEFKSMEHILSERPHENKPTDVEKYKVGGYLSQIRRKVARKDYEDSY